MIPFIVIGIVYKIITFKKKKMTNFTEQDAKKGIQEVKKIYGDEKAAIIERMYRLETNHFNSIQYKKTGSAGMEATKSIYPYGWNLAAFWAVNHKPVGLFTMPENQTKKIKTFIKFKTVTDAMLTLAYVLQKRNWNVGAWYSTQPESQKAYAAKVYSIKSILV